MKWVMALTVACALSMQAQVQPEWEKLLDKGKVRDTEAICTKMTNDARLSERVEAEKCLANVELSKGQQAQLTGNDTGGGYLATGYKPEAVDKALVHLDKGIQLAPQDKSLHYGRLHVLEVSGRFEQMAQAMEESMATLQNASMEEWMAYSFELGDMGQAKGDC